jgi:large subunit ribosomal protein L24
MDKILKNDQVQVMAGNDAGKKGKVLSVLPKRRQVVVEGVNFIKRHTKPNPQAQQQGGILEKEAPVNLSLVMVICDKCNLPTRAGIKVLENQKRTRYCKRCGEVIEQKK